MTRAEALACVPVRRSEVEWQKSEDGDILLTYPAAVRSWLARVLRGVGGSSPQTYPKQLQLDALGSEVWELIDGRRTVKEVIQTFKDHHQLHPKEAEVSVTQFLRELGKRGIIGLK